MLLQMFFTFVTVVLMLSMTSYVTLRSLFLLLLTLPINLFINKSHYFVVATYLTSIKL